MSNDLLKKVILVTGSGSGIGRACAILLAQSGAKVVVSDVVEAGGEETVAMIREAGGEATFIKTDISQPDQVQSLINQVQEQYGRLDCAVNNAGVDGRIAPLVEQEPADFDYIIRINLRGTFLCMKYEIAAMLKQGSGSIVNISSIHGLVTSPGMSCYAASMGLSV